MPEITPFRIGFIFFILTLIGMKLILGPAVCSDGWASPSIGSSGACSHHGGIRYNPSLIIALIVGGGIWAFLVNRAEKQSDTIAKTTDEGRVLRSGEPDIPDHSCPNSEVELYRSYWKTGGELSFDEWVKAREWMKGVDWSKRRDL